MNYKRAYILDIITSQSRSVCLSFMFFSEEKHLYTYIFKVK